MRLVILLRSEDGSTYATTKNKRNTSGRIELRKYCKRARKVVLFKEAK